MKLSMNSNKIEISVQDLTIIINHGEQAIYNIVASKYKRAILIQKFDSNGILQYPILTASPYTEYIINPCLTMVVYSSVYGISVCISMKNKSNQLVYEKRYYIDKTSYCWKIYFDRQWKNVEHIE